MNLDITQIAFHRNGISGEGFNVVTFTFIPDKCTTPEKFIGIVFDGPGQCAIIGIDRLPTMGIGMAEGNSWRGDCFEPQLRVAIESADTGRIGPFVLVPAMLKPGNDL